MSSGGPGELGYSEVCHVSLMPLAFHRGAFVGWLGCPRCERALAEVYVRCFVVCKLDGAWHHIFSGKRFATVESDGAVRVASTAGVLIHLLADQYWWVYPVPPADRWCDGSGGLHR